MNEGMLFVVGIMAVPFVFAIIIILIKSFDNWKRMQMKADFYTKAIEKGVELPQDLFEVPKKKHNSLKTGIILIFVGVGISSYLFLVAQPGDELRSAAPGLIPFFLGVGFLIVYLYLKSKVSLMKKSDSVYVLRAAILGDRNAYNRLVEEYQSQIRRFFLNLTEGDEELSKDLAQDTFIKAWMKIGSFRAAAKFSTWIYRIAYNTFYDYNRMNKHAKCIVDISKAGNFMVSDTNNKDIMMDFTKALSVLNEYEKIAMVLFYMEDMAINEISKIMKSPAGTVKSHLFRGKKKLSEYLEKSGYNK